MAGTNVLTGIKYDKYAKVKQYIVNITGDASDGSVPDLAIEMSGRLLRVVTNPGSTAPTANYDLTLVGPEDTALDLLAGAITNRHTSNTEQVVPAIAGTIGTVSSFPIVLSGSYTLKCANNSVNSATVNIVFYVADEI